MPEDQVTIPHRHRGDRETERERKRLINLEIKHIEQVKKHEEKYPNPFL